MKTEIEIQDELIEQADNAAQNLHITRDALLSRALEEYLSRRSVSPSTLTEQFNAVYAEEMDDEEKRTLHGMRRLAKQVIEKEPW